MWLAGGAFTLASNDVYDTTNGIYCSPCYDSFIGPNQFSSGGAGYDITLQGGSINTLVAAQGGTYPSGYVLDGGVGDVVMPQGSGGELAAPVVKLKPMTFSSIPAKWNKLTLQRSNKKRYSAGKE